MKLLALDTSTDLLSVALAHGERQWQHQSEGGPRASTALIPAVMDLLARAGLRLDELDAIAFGRGPGSFTGLRTACSVAQGLGFGAGVLLLPVDTLLAVAEQARWCCSADPQRYPHAHSSRASPAQPWRVQALLDARMDEIYHARWLWNGSGWLADGEIELDAPQAIAAWPGAVQAGNAFARYGARLPGGAVQIEALPLASAMLRVAPALWQAGLAVSAEHALPLYVRDKVAQTTDERLAAKTLAAAS